ncbi:hypothetical protein W115_86 [Escherichia phage W115]|nr:hypothetical protein W115_86 [Escherichia phage W115]
MQFNNMKVTKDWWDAMRDTPETKLNETTTTTTIQVDYEDPKDIYREILIRELIKAGNYQTPDGLIDMMVKGLYSGKNPDILPWYEGYFKTYRDHNRK